jgi:hypothetical protein
MFGLTGIRTKFPRSATILTYLLIMEFRLHPVHTFTPRLRSILILYYKLYSGSQGGLRLSDFPNVNVHVMMFFPQFVLHSLTVPYSSICYYTGRNYDTAAKLSRNAKLNNQNELLTACTTCFIVENFCITHRMCIYAVSYDFHNKYGLFL